MHPPKRICSRAALACASVLFCLTLLGSVVRASTIPIPLGRATVVSTMPSHSMPNVFGGMPCEWCYLASTPSPYGFNSDCKAPQEQPWRVQAVNVPDSTQLFNTGSRHPVLPVRIKYCRWLN